jgi:hypothetical protein
MKFLLVTASILLTLNSFACGGSGKDKEEDKDERGMVTHLND